MKQVGVNSYAIEHHFEGSKHSHFAGLWSEVERMVEMSMADKNYRDGDFPGCLIVRVEPAGFYTSVVPLEMDEKFESTYTPRRTGEKPYIQHIKYGKKVPASFVEIVVYSHETLVKRNEQSTNYPWEIVSINAFPEDVPSPMPPQTFARNILNQTGGTDRNLEDRSKDELIKMLRDMAFSIDFWNSHIQLMPRQ